MDNKWEKPHFNGTLYDMNEAVAILNVLKRGAPTNGVLVKKFEDEFAAFTGGKYGVATNSWGGGAQLLTILLDIKQGDEVIIPAMAMSATANFFALRGAKIVFAEVDPKTMNLDVSKLEEKITEKTKVVVAVHMCGQPADLDPISEIVKKHNLILIQDAAHAPGALYKGKPLASYGDFTIYSFHQAKNICTLGEGGMIVFQNEDYYNRLKQLRSHGLGKEIGLSNRMTEVQGAVGLEQLKKLPQHNKIRRKLAYYMNDCLKTIEGITIPYEIPDVYHVYHLYNIVLDEEKLGITKKKFIEGLWRKKRIMTISYAPAVNCLEPYLKLGHYAGECPVSEKVADNSIILPIAPWYTTDEMDEMYTAIKELIQETK